MLNIVYRDLYPHDIELDHPRRDRFHADLCKFSFYVGHPSGLTSKISCYLALIVVVFLVVIIACLEFRRFCVRFFKEV